MRCRSTAVLVLVVFLVAAAGCSDDPAVGEPFPVAETLMDADRAFAKASASHGAKAWTEVWADRGILYGDGTNPAVGPRETGKRIAAIVDRLRWEPTSSGMLWPGSLGYTVGHWWMAPGSGDASADAPRYLTVWQRSGGEWKVALDLSLPSQNDTGAAHDFDFFLGDWKLAQRIWSGDGDTFEPYSGVSQVRAIKGDGALVQTYQGNVRFFWMGMQKAAPIRGASVRFYDPDARLWRIFRIDSLDPKFGPPFNGSFSGVAGEFLLTDRPEGIPPSRIRFEPHTEGTVDWQLAIRTPDGKDWQPLWFIEYRRGEDN